MVYEILDSVKCKQRILIDSESRDHRPLYRAKNHIYENYV